MRFLADESCDSAVVTALRAAGHDVSAIVEIGPGTDDEFVLALAGSESRVLLTEDKDFGLLAHARPHETASVLMIRFPSQFRSSLGQAIVELVAEVNDRLVGAFVVFEPGRARISRRAHE